MSKQKKAKKPAGIKGRVMYSAQQDLTGRYLALYDKAIADNALPPASKGLVLPIDNPDALVEQVAKALSDEYWKDFLGEPDDETLARAALRSIGVPIKKGLIK
jgi:hypothetical protein